MALRIPRVRSAGDADQLAVKIHLFRNAAGEVCGWYIGPVAVTDRGVSLPYLPKSDETRATLAVVRAIAVAAEQHIGLCLIDPDDLWEPTWSLRRAPTVGE